MTYAAEHTIAGPAPQRAVTRKRRSAPARRPRCRDVRWPEVAATLAALHAAKRCSVRIVDVECGAGTLLLCAARFARWLGYTAIEARGVDAAPMKIERARVAAAAVHDPAIGITFEQGDAIAALREESEFPADIVLWHGSGRTGVPGAQRAAAFAGQTLIVDRPLGARVAA